MVRRKRRKKESFQAQPIFNLSGKTFGPSSRNTREKNRRGFSQYSNSNSIPLPKRKLALPTQHLMTSPGVLRPTSRLIELHCRDGLVLF